MALSGKSFVLMHTFKDIKRFEEGERQHSDMEERYGIPWNMVILKKDSSAELFLNCAKELCATKDWSIRVECTWKILSSSGKEMQKVLRHNFEEPACIGFTEGVKWRDVLDYTSNDNLIVEAHVKIITMTESVRITARPRQEFVLTHIFKNVSDIKKGNMEVGRIETHFNVPWRLCIKHFDQFAGLFLHCEKEASKTKNWSIQAHFKLKLVSANGKCLEERFKRTFDEDNGHGLGRVLRWDHLLSSFLVNDSVTMEAHVSIVKMFGVESDKKPNNAGKLFVLAHTFHNLRRFIDGEQQYSDMQERYNVPWNICIKRYDDKLSIFLCCHKKICNDRDWSVKVECSWKVISSSGKSLEKVLKTTFSKPLCVGTKDDFDWRELERDFMTNGSLIVEAHVKVIEVTDIPRAIVRSHRTFDLTHNFKNISSIGVGEMQISNVETHYNIPWRLAIKRNDEFVGFYLHCEKDSDKSNSWSIETEYSLKLLSANGKMLIERCEYKFDEEVGHGLRHVIRWNDMMTNLVVKDSITMEAHVTIIDMMGIKESTGFNELNSEFSECVIDIGGQKYFVKKC